MQWGIVYAAGAWGFLQGLEYVTDTFHWPDRIQQLSTLALLIGLPVALVLAWYHGDRGEQRVSRTELTIITLLFLMGGGIFWRYDRASVESPDAAPASTVAPASAARPALTGTTDSRPSIAVLPFANLSADKDNAYFAEGMQDEILTRLSKIAELRVISRTSTQRYASSPENLPDIAAELGVANILEGSVQKIGNAVRINVQLIRAETDAHLWAEIYDRQLVDVFSIQSEVTTAIAKALQATLTADEQRVVAARPTSTTAAYDAYLRGLALDDKAQSFTGVAVKARDQFAEAVRLDPDFAEAWRHLVQTTSLMYFNQIERTPAALARMEQAVAQVARLQPDSGEAWLAQGYYRYRGLRDFAGALDAFQKASARLPNNTETLVAMALVERRQGDMPDALAHVAQAEQLDPRNAQTIQVKSEFLLALRRFPEARAAIDRTLELLPGDSTLLAAKITSFQGEGDLPAAQRLVDAPPADDPDDSFKAARITQDWWTGRFDDAIASCHALIQAGINRFNPFSGFDCQFSIAIAQRLKGDAAAATATCEAILKRIERPDSAALGDAGRAYYRGLAEACLGRKAQAMQDLQAAIAAAQGDTRELQGFMVASAIVHAQFGEVDAAVAILKNSLQVPYGVTVGQLRFDPMWSSIRKDPRFQALLVASG